MLNVERYFFLLVSSSLRKKAVFFNVDLALFCYSHPGQLLRFVVEANLCWAPVEIVLDFSRDS